MVKLVPFRHKHGYLHAMDLIFSPFSRVLSAKSAAHADADKAQIGGEFYQYCMNNTGN